LNLQKAFENRRDRLWPAFKIGELALFGFKNRRVGFGRLSKLANWLWPAFKIGELALGRLSKALGTAPKNLLSNRSKGFELAGLKSFLKIQKLFALNGEELINSR
jgi:hypothetical protein